MIKESTIQIQYMRWFHYQYPQYKKLCFHVPNGGSRHKLEAINLKKQGVKKGVADVIILVPIAPYHGLTIELKSDEGKLSDDQLEFLFEANQKGYLGVVESSLKNAVLVTDSYFSFLL
jgi:hypothetical protein